MPFDFGSLNFSLDEVMLCPLSIQHTEQLAQAAGEDPSIYRFNNCPAGLEETELYIQKALKAREQGTRYPFAIFFQGRVVGTTSYADYQPWTWQKGNPLQRQNIPDALEIGYTWLSKSATRTQCNTSAKYLLLRHAFEELNVVCVSFQTDERNTVSRAALERLGTKFEGVRRAHKVGADGTIRSSALYSILAEEWPAARDHLESKLPASILAD
jgi:RimJ/RimL family protein N-acetyltransferase